MRACRVHQTMPQKIAGDDAVTNGRRAGFADEQAGALAWRIGWGVIGAIGIDRRVVEQQRAVGRDAAADAAADAGLKRAGTRAFVLADRAVGDGHGCFMFIVDAPAGTHAVACCGGVAGDRAAIKAELILIQDAAAEAA